MKKGGLLYNLCIPTVFLLSFLCKVTRFLDIIIQNKGIQVPKPLGKGDNSLIFFAQWHKRGRNFVENTYPCDLINIETKKKKYNSAIESSSGMLKLRRILCQLILRRWKYRDIYNAKY